MSENSDGNAGTLAVGNGACVGGRVMPGGGLAVALALVVLGVVSVCRLESRLRVVLVLKAYEHCH
jgi:hypothetical protein